MWGVGRVEIQGKALEYQSWGPKPRDGTAIILLHEGLGCVALWRDFPMRLHEVTGLPVLAYSRAGYGRSDPDELPRPLDWMTREATRVLPEFLRAFGLDVPILVGHSDGATIAALYAAHGGDPRRLILMAPHFFTEPEGLAEIARARDAFAASDMAHRMGKYHNDPKATFRGWADAWLDPAFERWNVEKDLTRITCPVLVIQGRQDQFGTLAQIETLDRHAQGPVAKCVLEDCRHIPHLEQPQNVLEAIASSIMQ